MSYVSPFVNLIENWPKSEGKSEIQTMCADLGAKYPTVAAWKERGSIPPERWPDLIKAADKRGITLTLETLHAWPKPKRSKKRKRVMQ